MPFRRWVCCPTSLPPAHCWLRAHMRTGAPEGDHTHFRWGQLLSIFCPRPSLCVQNKWQCWCLKKGANLFPRLILSTCFEEARFMCNRCALHVVTKRACYLFFQNSVVFPQKKIMIFSSSLISPFHIFSSFFSYLLSELWDKEGFEVALWVQLLPMSRDSVCFMGLTPLAPWPCYPFWEDSQGGYFTSQTELCLGVNRHDFSLLSKIKSSELVFAIHTFLDCTRNR